MDNTWDLFPPIEPYVAGELRLEQPHKMYWEQSGNPEGLPVLFLHGGPGAGVASGNRRFFNPSSYRIILYDQRGAGRSTPLGELSNNTTSHLVGDIETLRKQLGIEKWVLFGGSWGSTLALVYAETYPDRVLAMILRGIFLCRKSEIQWFLYGMRTIFPEYWDLFSGFLPPTERDDILANYYHRLIDPDPSVHMPAALAWSRYEGSCSTLLPSKQIASEFERRKMALSLARIEAHYFMNDSFLPEGRLLENADRLRNIPATIVQGRYDAVCPFVSAYDLHKVWPEAEFSVVADAGHSSLERGICSALVAATERIRRRSENGR